MSYTNAQILSAVLSTYLEPLIQPVVNQISSEGLRKIPALNMVENKIKSWGIVSPNWSLANEITPFSEVVFGKVITPLINKYVSQLPDESIPDMAHGIVDKALQDGEIKILDGYVTLDKEDIQKLKNLLNWNLPLEKTNRYEVVTSEPA